jgi:hypothetical protein
VRIPAKRPPIQRGASRELDGFFLAGGVPKKKAPAKKGPKACAKHHAVARELAATRAASRKWDDAFAQELVGLYSLLHERVYGVIPDELDGPAYFAAVAAAGRTMTTLGSAEKVFEFIRWTWKREDHREQKRRDEHADGSRIGWRLQFAPAMITDYRVAQERARPRKK